MGSDKHGSKSGRYVGGFFQLFDWNAKSRKKLFPSKSDLPEQLKQGKQSEGSLPMTRMRVLQLEDDEYGGGFCVRGGSEYSYASSVTDDDGYGTKAPGVVARLMGLDSLPTSNGMEPYASPLFETLSLQDFPMRRRNLDLYRDHQMMHSSHLLDNTARSVLDGRSQKVSSRPIIEKFQTETLPPRSAKTIPITHHKLLSPIKSPIFVPSQDAAHIMEAASKIIDPGPQGTSRTKISTVRSSSVPLKVRELRERLEATQRPVKVADLSQRPVESNAAKSLRGQPMNKSWNGTVDATAAAAPAKVSTGRGDSSSAKNKGKSISLAIQAKNNVQKREGMGSSSRSLASEQDGSKSTQSFRDQPSSSKISNRKALSQGTSSVLRQNNQKQNCPTYRDRPTSKTPVANSTGKRAVTEDASHGRHKSSTRDAGISRTSSRKSSLHARESDKGAPHTGARNTRRKKRSIDGSSQFNQNRVSDNMLAAKNENSSSSSSMVADRQFTWIEESRRKGMDVVSFTFTAPITRSLPGSEPLRQLTEKNSDLFTDDRSKLWTNSDITKLSSPGFNGIRGDALSILLEQKLKELASNLGSPHSFVKTGSTSDSGQRNAFSPGSVESAIGKAQEKAAQQEHQSVRRIFNFQAGESVEDYSHEKIENKQWNGCHVPSPISILEPSMLTESCYSSESIASSCTEESKPSSSVVAQEVIGLCTSQKFHPMDTDVDISDSATSTSSQMSARKDPLKLAAWELGYVKDILWNVELMFKDYVTGRTREIVNPHLFEQMERRRGGGFQMGVDDSKLERKVLFDCVSECLDLRCQRFVGGGYEMWMKGIATLKRKERLAEEVYKEIRGWRSLGNSNVDELVDKDMSSKYGRWSDFEADEFMLGVEIEGEILDSMVVEIVADLLP